MPSVVRGSEFLANLRASRRMALVSGRMKCRRICVRSERSYYTFEGLMRTPGSSSVAMGLREEFTIGWSRTTVFMGKDLS